MPVAFSELYTRVNLVEEEGWKPFDSAEIMEPASLTAWEEFIHVGAHDCADWLDELFERSPGGRKRWPKRPERDELAAVCEALQEDPHKFEALQHLFVDALTWMYEEAMTPTDRDIRHAFEEALELASRDIVFESWLWDSVWKRAGLTEEKAVDELTSAKRVFYERQPGWYDRYVTFDWRDAKVIEAVRKYGNLEVKPKRWKPLSPEEEDQRQDEIDDALFAMFEGFVESVLTHFFRLLVRRMEATDVYNRTDFKKHWKASLGEHAAAARQEVLEFLREGRAA